MNRREFLNERYQRSKNKRKVAVRESIEEEVVDTELLRVIRNKVKKVGYSLEFERNGYVLLDQFGYLSKKGSLMQIDDYCVLNDIYMQEDRASSLNQILLERVLQKELES